MLGRTLAAVFARLVSSPALSRAQGVLELPPEGFTPSGIGLISGWVCGVKSDRTLTGVALHHETLPKEFGPVDIRIRLRLPDPRSTAS
jgi:hypothetical protein